MKPELRRAWSEQMAHGRRAHSRGEWAVAVHHFERAHILGQRSTRAHVRAHVGLLQVAWRQRAYREILGQVVRIAAAALFSRLWVPVGNTGSANVSAFQPMPISDDLRELLRNER